MNQQLLADLIDSSTNRKETNECTNDNFQVFYYSLVVIKIKLIYRFKFINISNRFNILV